MSQLPMIQYKSEKKVNMNSFDKNEITKFRELEELIRSSSINYDLESIRNAYEFMLKAHGDQQRLTGELYTTHCLTVAKYLIQLNLDTTSIISALLHDVIDQAGVELDELDKVFGTEVAFLVNGMTNIRQYSKQYVGVNENDVENFKHLIFKSVEDIRVLIIRLAEKVHNLRSMHCLEPERRKASATRILQIYAPLAEYLGLGVFQREFQDRGFEILNPEEYKFTKKAIEELFEKSGKVVDKFKRDLTKLLGQYGIRKFDVQGRKKGIYSSYVKCRRKHLKKDEPLKVEAFQNLNDVFAFRIILQDVEQCYMTLGLIHSNWEYDQNEFDDYISKPKPNGYKSIHTVIDYNGDDIEIQIRTEEMHEFNEYGPSSHIAYKLQGGSKKSAGDAYTWTKDLVRWKEKKTLSKEDFQVKAFSNSIFVFTPKGLVVRLDKGATPLDFAFSIHTDIGYHYKGALVNEKMVPMRYKLQTGDVVEILTKKNVNANRDWLKYAKMSETRSRIRRYIRQVERKREFKG